ncbi:ketopantoate reductase family protein [Halomonas korlensis]|uniref:2-dehydropantoate 2-reductase n=1 Tax=Halomonas korlensis TaxID=463301 RepID=A0A1I7KB16_9GAMM|nr:2-dehydropantoate 2-reductase [Halomonas korlensis]SFU94611.1 2-dehydropantoate 2-reductase [Halomonas korlensis]
MTLFSHWIVGPGALGRLIALRLADHARVTLVGRRPPSPIQRLMTPEGETLTRRLGVAVIGALPDETPSIVHLTTKATTALPASDALARALPMDSPLVLWQNGVGSQQAITQRWPGPVLCASTTEGAHVQGDTQVTHAGHGRTFIGALDGRHRELASQLAGVLTLAGLSSEPVDDIGVRLWRKLAVNAAINPLVARFGIANGELRDPPYRSQVEALIEEIAAIMAAEGLKPPEGEGIDGWRQLVWQVIDATAGNLASMLQDVMAGRPTEHEAILGPLLAAARRHKLPAEHIEMHFRYLAAHQST